MVTGSSGFLGSYTADALMQRGYHVVCFDLTPMKKQLQGVNFTQIIGSVLDVSALDEAMDGVQYVYHFAGMADIEQSNDHPFDVAQTNLLGTINVLKACVDHSVKRFVFSSTVYVYSRHGGFYRASKQACENFIEL